MAQPPAAEAASEASQSPTRPRRGAYKATEARRGSDAPRKPQRRGREERRQGAAEARGRSRGGAAEERAASGAGTRRRTQRARQGQAERSKAQPVTPLPKRGEEGSRENHDARKPAATAPQREAQRDGARARKPRRDGQRAAPTGGARRREAWPKRRGASEAPRSAAARAAARRGRGRGQHRRDERGRHCAAYR